MHRQIPVPSFVARKSKRGMRRARVFFYARSFFMASCAGQPSGWPVSFLAGTTNLAQLAALSMFRSMLGG